MTPFNRHPVGKVRSLSKRRRQYAQLRLKQLILEMPTLPADILDSCELRQLSAAVRRCGQQQQTLSETLLSSTFASEPAVSLVVPAS